MFTLNKFVLLVHVCFNPINHQSNLLMINKCLEHHTEGDKITGFLKTATFKAGSHSTRVLASSSYTTSSPRRLNQTPPGTVVHVRCVLVNVFTNPCKWKMAFLKQGTPDQVYFLLFMIIVFSFNIDV